MKSALNKSEEDYLRTIYTLQENEFNGVRSIEISRSLNVTKPSVNSMINKLKDKNLIKCDPYSKIFLTKKGTDIALKITHNHRVIEVFLKKVLDYDVNEVHDEAHRLEHAFSEDSIKRLDTYLKNPKISPNGKLIPH